VPFQPVLPKAAGYVLANVLKASRVKSGKESWNGTSVVRLKCIYGVPRGTAILAVAPDGRDARATPTACIGFSDAQH
jgi:hypothetical protein